MSNAMLGPPPAVAGGAVAGAAGSGVVTPNDPGGVGAEFMALVAGLLAGLVPGTQPQAQTPTTAPGPNDGKVLQETGADGAALELPQGLAEQAAAAAGVARAVLAVDPHAAGPRSPKGLLHAHVEHGLRPDGAWTGNRGASRADAAGGIGAPSRDATAPASVSFTMTPTGTAQDVPVAAPPVVPVTATEPTEVPVDAEAPPTPPVVPVTATEPTEVPVDAEAPPAPVVPGATTTPGGPTSTPIAAQDAAAAETTESVDATDETPSDDSEISAPPAPSSSPVERPKDVGQARQVLPAHSPPQLARELADHLRVAVREEGREIQISLRPAELGNLTIRVTMQDGVLQAHIAADRPESARLLEQSLRHLEDMLADRGYEMGSLDVNTGGPDARETAPRMQDTRDHEHRRGRGHDHHDHDDSVAAGSAPVAVVAHDGDVNLLA